MECKDKHFFIKPGCDKEFLLRLPGINASDVNSMKIVFKRSAERKSREIFSVEYPSELVVLNSDGEFEVLLRAQDTDKLPMGEHIYIDILPVLSDGFRVPVEMCRALTTETLKAYSD